MFRNVVLALLTLALSASPAFAQKRRPEPAPQARETQRAITPALFVARDADSTIYIFGTIHLRRPGAAWGGPEAQRALGDAEEVWTEINISGAGTAELQQLILDRARAPADRPLSSWLTPEEYARFTAVTGRLGVSASFFENMQPWFVALTLSVLPMMQAGYDPEAGADQAVVAAVPGGARLRAFETAEQQLGFLADLPPELQRQYLLEVIDQTDVGVAELDSMAEAWERGDLDALERLVIDESRANYPEFYDVIFTRRNNAWIAVLVQELEGSGVDFVAVGAGHVIGPDGLVAQLRARGVEVERLE